MDNLREILELSKELMDVSRRASAAQALARALRAEDLVVFLRDLRIDAFLPAPGFRQTLPDGRQWQEFLAGCTVGDPRQGALPWPTASESRPVTVVVAKEGVAAALIGGEPGANPTGLRLVLPLIGGALRGEMAEVLAASREATAARSIRRADQLVSALDDARRELEHAFSEIRDLNISLEARVEDRVKEIHAMNEQLLSFSYTISHDLRAPIRAIRGYVDALIDDHEAELSPVAQLYLERTIRATERMDHLIRDLLAYSRVTQIDVVNQPVVLDSVVDTALRALHEECRDPELAVHRALADPSPVVMAHRITLVQVVVNLLTNAVKFVEPGKKPEVVIGTSEGERPRLWIRDRGVGIAPDHQGRIFEVFERLRPSEYPGTGIGLAIVKAAVERMGGRVGVKSAPGQGSEFWVEFERAVVESAPADIPWPHHV